MFFHMRVSVLCQGGLDKTLMLTNEIMCQGAVVIKWFNGDKMVSMEKLLLTASTAITIYNCVRAYISACKLCQTVSQDVGQLAELVVSWLVWTKICLTCVKFSPSRLTPLIFAMLMMQRVFLQESPGWAYQQNLTCYVCIIKMSMMMIVMSQLNDQVPHPKECCVQTIVVCTFQSCHLDRRGCIRRVLSCACRLRRTWVTINRHLDGPTNNCAVI